MSIQRCDIFCTVIDNFGDIGVCWRLARQLQQQYQMQVRLFVDELQALQMLCPQAVLLPYQQLEQIDVYHWQPAAEQQQTTDPTLCSADFSPAAIADLVIEAFACELPADYIDAMATVAARGKQPHWLNLEYLATEDWADDCHGLSSMHPANGLRKQFYFPGFSLRTGGLLCEANLLNERDTWQANPQQRAALLQRLGVEWDTSTNQRDPLLISLFAYQNPAVAALLQTLSMSTNPVLCLVPEGKILPQVATALGCAPLRRGDCLQQGNLTVQVLPFLEQRDYDRLLWSCDLNLVRGEDSFVRAQWAGRPLIWQIYPQADDAHLDKLEAFLQRYSQTLPPALATQVLTCWRAWNQPDSAHPDWAALLAALADWQHDARRWAETLLKQGDLAANMLQFLQNHSD